MSGTGTLHPLHRLWRVLPQGGRRRLLAGGAALLAPRPDRVPPPVQPGLAVAGEIGRASGLGQSARLFLAAAERLELPCWGIEAGLPLAGEARSMTPPRPPPPLSPPLLPPPPLPPRGVPLLLHVNAPQVPPALLRLPRRLLRHRRVIGYWAWELPRLPPEWRAGLPFVHEVWTLSQFSAAALEPLLPGRVRVVPPPVALRPPVPAVMDRQAFGLPNQAVITLAAFSLASSFERKNPLGAIAAHRLAFGDRPDRLLVMKLSHAAHYPDDVRRLRQAIGGAGNIHLETRTLPDAENHALMQCADIVLSLHRSEGFGLVPAEAMLLGKPVVATGWSGNLQFMDADCAALTGYRLIPAHDPRGVFQAEGAVWADPDLDDAAAWLRQLADDAALRADLGVRGQRAAQQRLGPGAFETALRSMGMPLHGESGSL